MTLLLPALSANSPAILSRSKALLASPCSLAAKAAHLAITPSSTTFSLNPSALLKSISCNCNALYGGKTTSSSESELLTLGSKSSKKVKLLLIPTIHT